MSGRIVQWIAGPELGTWGESAADIRRIWEWGPTVGFFVDSQQHNRFDAVDIVSYVVFSLAMGSKLDRHTFPLLQWMRTGWFRRSSTTLSALATPSLGTIDPMVLEYCSTHIIYMKDQDSLFTKGSLLPGMPIWKCWIPTSFMNLRFFSGYSSGNKVLQSSSY